MQNIPLRSPLNLALFDMRKLEYDIRRTVQAADRLASTNLLKDCYVEEIMTGKRSEMFTEMIPKVHRRRSPEWKRTECVKREVSPVNVLKRSADILSLQLKCRKAKHGVALARRSITRTKISIRKSLGKCSDEVDRVLRFSQSPFLPVHTPTSSLSPPPLRSQTHLLYRSKSPLV